MEKGLATTEKFISTEKPTDLQPSLEYASMPLREKFRKWLEDGNALRFSPRVAIECLDKISEYIINKDISCSIWEITKPRVYKLLYQRIIDAKYLRVMQRDTYKVFTVVGQLYAKFLKEKPSEKLIEEPGNESTKNIIEDHLFEVPFDKRTDSLVVKSLPDIKAEDIIAWLVTQPNVNGTLYLSNVMNSYMSALRNAPQKLTLSDSINRNVFSCHTVEELDTLWDAFKTAPNYIEINRASWHGQLSAGLATYRRYLEYLAENGQREKNDQRVAIEAKSQSACEIPQQLAASGDMIPDSLFGILNKNFASGFRFDTTALLLLGAASEIEIDEHIQTALKQKMFYRDDGIYFLLDTVADAAIRNEIVDCAEVYLHEFGCFEISEIYRLYEDKVNPKCIGNADDFESFYKQIGNSDVRCVSAPQIGNRIARFSNGNVWDTFRAVSVKIVTTIAEEFYGSISEDDLHSKFGAFSTDLLAKIVKNCAADELVRVVVNDSICYQTFDALGLPENFPDILLETLGKLEDVGLEPSQDVLHTALSLNLGVNFSSEFNLPDWDTYRRLIKVFYKAEPHREWKRNKFAEVMD